MLATSLFIIFGRVEKNLGRGRKLGYPTANFPIAADAPEGIFVGYTTVKDRRLPSLIFVGPAITFGETDKKAEIYILDFDEDIYDQIIEVDVVKKLRDNIKFASAEELTEQMKQDEVEARKFF
ncbi:hypothetical protein BH09PAT2_BH09PAT2_09180 [soil metagenome]